MQNPVPLPKRPLGLIFSTSLPRFGGDFSGSFVPEWHSLLNRETKIPVRWIAVGLDDPAVRRRGLSKTLYIRYMWPRRMQVLGHGGTKQIFRSPLRLTAGLLCLPGLFFITPLALNKIYRRLFTPRVRTAGTPVYLWSHFIFPSALFLGGLRKACDGFHVATAHSSDVHLLSATGPLGRLLTGRMLGPERTQLVQASCKPVFLKLTRMTGPGPTAAPFIQPMLPVSFVGDPPGQAPATGLPSPTPNSQLDSAAPNIDRELRILYIGSMHPVKGIAAYLNALDKALHSRDTVGRSLQNMPKAPASPGAMRTIHLQIIGDGPDYSRIAATAHRLNKAAHAKKAALTIDLVRGRVPKRQMPGYLSSAHFILVPSRNMAGFSEGLPVTAWEALAVGRPVLATNSGGLPELFSGHEAPGILYPNLDAMAAGTLELAGRATFSAADYQRMEQACCARLKTAWNQDFLIRYKNAATAYADGLVLPEN